MKEQLQHIIEIATKAISTTDTLDNVESIRVKYLGKKGELTAILKGLQDLPASEKPAMGQLVNQAKQTIQHAIIAKQTELKEAELNQRLNQEVIDITLPGVGQSQGSLHPVIQIIDRIADIFKQLGFSIETGPEIEDEYHNFDALNIPKTHPARTMCDTFYFDDGRLLRTHTSNVQIRALKKQGAPIRLIAPGRVYRSDSDLTHTPMFHQVEGLALDTDLSFADLKGVLEHFLKQFFEKDVPVRFRPSYFPFTEPSAEVDIGCVKCEQRGCRICGQTGWLEILGCGMVHPNVLLEADVDPDMYSGFAFGLGVERIAMLYYGISDLRILFENDYRFLQQF